MSEKMTGPIGAYSGATPDTITRDITCIEVVEEALFEELVLMFPADVSIPHQEAITALPFPPLFRILNVKSFKLTSGSILVAFQI